MPEDQVSKTITDMMVLGKGMPSDISPQTQLFRFEIVPISLSKNKENIIVSKEFPWTSSTDSAGWQTYAPNPRWIERADACGLLPLMAVVPYAPLICRSRGKLGCFAAGPHAIVVVYALQSNVIGMPLATYRSIIANDSNHGYEGTETESGVFNIPEEYTVPYSSRRQRTIKIFAAFVSDRWAWVFNDFNSLITIHVCSRDQIWTPDDLIPGSPHWIAVFNTVKKGGPDWLSETLAAKTNLLQWRIKIRREHQKRHFQHSLFSYWPSETKKKIDTHHALITNPNRSYTSTFRPILSEILANRCNCFAGIGNYSASELLHELTIHPFTPSYVICEDDSLFEALQAGIYRYLSQFSSPSFLQRASSVPNTSNPFAFNDHFNNEFLSKWIRVYQRTTAIVPVELYNRLSVQHLLDPNYIIGEPHPEKPGLLLDETKRHFVYLPVFKCMGPNKETAYTVICAKLQPEWSMHFTQDAVDVDIKQFSFRTSIGPSQFHVPLLNRPNYDGVEPGILSVGRPKSNRTGKAGRPRKGLTKKKLLRHSKSHIGRRRLETPS